MAALDDAWTQTLGLRSLDEIEPANLQHRGAGHAGIDGHEKQAERHGGENKGAQYVPHTGNASVVGPDRFVTEAG